MMKHIQEPPPSILEERADLPAEVGRVIARALAKKPEDRFQSAADLSAALTAAAAEGAPLGAVAAGAAVLDTDRIGSPTSPNEPARTTVVGADEDDEATVVGRRYTSAEAVPATTGEERPLPPPVAPLPEPAFNPWRIAVPAIAAVAIIFAVFFAFQRRGVSSEQTEQPPLQADPNSQAGQPITPPTGQAETNLAPAGGTPTPAATPGEAGGGVPSGGAPDANVNAAPSPTPEGGKSNPNPTPTPAEEEAPEEEDEPAPTPTPRRNKRLPDINANVEPPPPPKQEKPKEDKPPDAPPSIDDAPAPPAAPGA
jgi:serine/threonine-protein kinase